MESVLWNITEFVNQSTQLLAANQDTQSLTASQDTQSLTANQDTQSLTANQNIQSLTANQDTQSLTANQDTQSWKCCSSGKCCNLLDSVDVAVLTMQILSSCWSKKKERARENWHMWPCLDFEWIEHLSMCLWWSSCTLYLLACQVRVTIGVWGLFCCVPCYLCDVYLPSTVDVLCWRIKQFSLDLLL